LEALDGLARLGDSMAFIYASSIRAHPWFRIRSHLFITRERGRALADIDDSLPMERHPV
jgi:hypothetical protein